MRILVVYATANGSTGEIATEIGERLAHDGHAVEVHPVASLGPLGACDAVVLGSAVHGGQWLPEATSFVDAHLAELGRQPVWCFSVSSVGETTSAFGPRLTRTLRARRRDPEAVAQLRRGGSLRDHRHFAGVIRASDWGRLGALFMAVFRGRYGDHRDWSDIRAWADAVGRAG